MSIQYSFAGKRVLIVGGTQEAGLQLVHRLHEVGATVFVLDENSEAVKRLNRQLSDIYAECVDLSNSEVTIKAIKQFGWIDYLVNNIEIKLPHSFQQDSLFSFCGVQIGMAMKISETVTKAMFENGAQLSIVDVYTITSTDCADCWCYSSTKKALQGLVKAVAKELHPYKVRLNCIIRGGESHPPIQGSRRLSDNVMLFIENLVAKMTMKLDTETEELADLILLLLSPFAALMVGKSFVVSDEK